MGFSLLQEIPAAYGYYEGGADDPGGSNGMGELVDGEWSSKRLKFLNDFREQAYILLITNVEENYNIVKYGMEDINKLSSTINSVMFKEV